MSKVFSRYFKRYFVIWLLVSLVISALLYLYYREKVNHYYQNQIDSYYLAYQIIMDIHKENSRLAFEEDINQDDVLAIVARAYHGNKTQRDAARKELYSKLLPVYRKLERREIRQLHFHLPDNTSLIRFHEPEKYGDDLSDYRYSVAKANAEKIDVVGFEIGRIFHGYRYIIPLFYSGDFVGSVELTTGFQAIRNHLETQFPGNYGLILKKSIIDRKVFPEERDHYIISELSDDYYYDREYAPIDGILKLDHRLNQRVKDQLAGEKAFGINQRTDEGCWMVVFLPIKNIHDETVAYAVRYSPDNTFSGYVNESVALFIIAMLVTAGLLFFYYLSKKSERTLTEERQKFEAVVNATDNIIFAKDLNLLYTYVNPAFQKLIGKDQKDIINRKMLDIIEAVSYDKTHSDQAVLEGHHINTQLPVTINGEVRYIDINKIPHRDGSGKIIGLFGVGRDITDQINSARKIKEDEIQLRTLINATPDFICLKDGEGRWLIANDAGLELFGLTGKEYIGKNDLELAAMSDPIFRDVHMTCIASDKNAWKQKMPVRENEIIPLQDGGNKVLDVIKVPVFDENNRQKGLVVFGRDITELKEYEKLIIRQERLASVGQLAAGIAHDFNNILTGILGSSEIIMMKDGISGESRQYLDIIHKSSIKAAKLVRQILDFSRKTMIRPEIIDLSETVHMQRVFFSRTISENIAIKYDSNPTHSYNIVHDAGQIDQVLLNLVVNARDSIEDSGEIKIGLDLKVFPESKSPVCAICGFPLIGDWIQLEIADTGSGIPEENIGKIFEPFFTTKEQGRGTGLGLSQIAGIVGQNGGHITVSSEVGKGSIFRVYYRPASDSTSLPVSHDNVLLNHPEQQRLLVIEDDPTTLKIHCKYLEMLGYYHYSAANALDALDIYREHMRDIHAVISDIVLPDKSGQFVFEEIIKMNPDEKFIFITGYPLNTGNFSADDTSNIRVLNKPIDLKKLSETIKQLIR